MPTWKCYGTRCAVFISNSHRFIFIHLQKTAGTSIEVALSHTLQWNDILSGSTSLGERLQPLYRDLFGFEKHSNAHEVRQLVGDRIWSEYFTFSLVRNPFSRVASLYTFSRSHTVAAYRALRFGRLRLWDWRRRNAYPEVWPWYYPGTRAILESGLENASFSDFLRSDPLKSWYAFRPQTSQLCDPATGKPIVDLVGRVESLEADWSTICKRIGIGPCPLGHQNRSADPGAWQRLFERPEDADLIRDLHRSDFETFGYSMDIPRCGS